MEDEKDDSEPIYISEFSRSMQAIAEDEPAERFRALDGVLFKGFWVMATNGRMAAIGPRGDDDGLDGDVVIKFNRKAVPDITELHAYNRTADTLVPLTGPDAGFPTAVIKAEGEVETRSRYPDILRLIREIADRPSGRNVRLVIDAHMLNQLAKLITMGAQERVVMLEVTPEENGTVKKPVIVVAGIQGERAIEPCGIIMPCAGEGTETEPRHILSALLNWDGDWKNARDPITATPDENWPLEI